MTRKLLMIGAATVALTGAVAVTPAMADPLPQAATYADLLEPVPNAMQQLAASDAATQAQPMFQLAQWNDHHHHHAYRRDRSWYLNNGYSWYGGRWVMRRDHHHHHAYRRDRSWYLNNGYSWYGGRWVQRRDHHHHHHNNW